MKMTNFDIFEQFLKQFDIYNNNPVFTSTLYDASYDNTNRVYVYEKTLKNLKVLNFDEFAHKIYMHKYFSEDECKEFAKNKSSDKNSLASVDAFLIDKNSDWFFIEFKNQKINNTKDSVTKKAYQNLFWIFDIFFENKNNPNIPNFDFNSPIEFARKKITFILVVPENENYSEVSKIINLENSKDHYRPEFMNKIKHYAYKDAYVYTTNLFESYFVKKFNY